MFKITSDQAVYTMNAVNPPVLAVKPGSEVIFETKDCFNNQITNTEHLFSLVEWNTINPATGPLFIDGAEPGDTLVVDILSINIADQGCMVCIPEGILAGLIKTSETKIIPIEQGHAVFNSKLKLPVSPMIGVIGTAPALAEISCGIPGEHGGNMDTRYITAGTRLYLPVFVTGALLAIGDLHAIMADGEVSLCGVEIPGEVKVRVEVFKGVKEKWPILETETDWFIIASGKDLDEASQYAMESTIEFLLNRTELAMNDVVMLLSLVGNLEISQVVDPLKTVRMRVPKSVLDVYKLKF